MATTAGSAYRIDPQHGMASALAPAARGLALALPLGKKALFLGGGRHGARLVSTTGSVRVLGDAAPVGGALAVNSSEGVAWLDRRAGQVLWIGADAQQATLSGLGSDIEHLGIAPGCVLATTGAGTLRCVEPGAPAELSFEAPLGGRAGSDPFPLGHAVFVLVDGVIVAIEN